MLTESDRELLMDQILSLQTFYIARGWDWWMPVRYLLQRNRPL